MKVTITHELIEQSKTQGGAWSRAQLEAFGVSWPPPKGWKSAIVGTVVDKETLERFHAARLELTNKARNKAMRKIEQKQMPLSAPVPAVDTSQPMARHTITLGLDADVVQWLRENRISNDFINDSLRKAIEQSYKTHL